MKSPRVYSRRRHIFSGCILLVWLILLVYRYFVLEVSHPDRTLWVVDASLSMSVEDIGTSNIGIRMSRLDLAKSLISEGIRTIPWEHAIISYARDASVEAPFSLDKEYLKNVVSNLTSISISGGSDLMSAFMLVRSLYVTDSIPLRIVILTDGGSTTSTLEDIQLPAAYAISFIGIGSPLGGKIPLGYDASGERRYKYFSGEEIIVRYEAWVLENFADAYDASLIHFQGEWALPSDILTKVTTEKEKSFILFLASLLILIAYFITPYAPKR